jgi:hypothetical protein
MQLSYLSQWHYNITLLHAPQKAKLSIRLWTIR